MANFVMLNNVAHRNLRVITGYGAQYGDQVGTALAFPNEFANLQREYPIFFRKDPSNNEFQAMALLGLQKDENLFLEGSEWTGRYVPLSVARGPFLIGFQDKGGGQRERVINLDLEHPRVSRTEGELLFTPEGANTPYLDHVANLLGGISTGLELSKAMFAAFTEHDLIEPLKLDIKLTGGGGIEVVGLHTINQTKLAELDAASLHKLHQSGFLECAFLAIASVGNVNRLISRRYRAATSQTAMAS